MEETPRCPYCAEEIRPEAVRCPHCRSRLAAFDPERWRRDYPERRIAGVSTALAHALCVPLTVVRVAFVVLTFIHFVGPLAYAALWAAIPYAPGQESPLEHGFAWARDFVRQFRGNGSVPPPNVERGPIA
jgi:phage shock protein PspC (stress-responsive transcriptional regulator)